MSRMSLDRLLRPRSVAIVGASPTPGALGASVLANLERAGYAGAIHLVNPRRAEIDGRACVASVDDLPEGVDCAVFAIPRAAVLDTLRACGRRGVGGAIIFSAGFAEAGDEGRAEQEELAAIARAHGIVVAGPNCLGIVNFIDGVPLTFVETPAQRRDGGPRIAVVSQSGAMAAVASVSLRSRDLGISFTVSTGNEAASGVEDYVEYLIGDDSTRVISMIVEQFRTPRRFLSLARRARDAGKLIVLIHPGRSAAARASAATHTGAIAGDHTVMSSLVRDAGVILVDTLEELLDVTEIVLRCVAVPDRGPMVIAESGWLKAQILDLCDRHGLALPALEEASAARLAAVLPPFIQPANPLDITAQGLVQPELYEQTLDVLVNDPRYGCIVLPIILTDPNTAAVKLPPILRALRRLSPTKAIIFAGVDEGAEIQPDYIDQLRSLHVPFFPSPERALRALACIVAARAGDARQDRDPVPTPCALPVRGVVAEYLSKEILAGAGVKLPRGRLARTLDEAQSIAAELGFPVVLKAQAAALPHKSDAGGVILSLADPAALAAGWSTLFANVKAHDDAIVLDGALVETMGRRGLELIVGARNDPAWGPVVLVGMGGVQAEILKDAVLLPAGVSRTAILAAFATMRSAPLFAGYRGEPALDMAAAADIVAKVGGLIRANPDIAEIDINPVVVYPDGQGAIALDGLMVVR